MIGGATALGVKAGGAWSELLCPSAKSTYKICLQAREREREREIIATYARELIRQRRCKLACEIY